MARRLRGIGRRLLRRGGTGLPPIRGSFNEPATPTLHRALVYFSGWALEGDELPARVELTFNGATTVEAKLGHERPDVPRSLGQPRATSACAWSAWVDLAAWPEGDLEVTITAFTKRGRPVWVESRSFELTGSGFVGSLDTPRDGEEVQGDSLVVQGWASIDGRGPARVEVSIDGLPVGRARLRVARPDVAIPGRELGPLAGFEYRASLSESGSAGVEISVAVVGFEGGRECLPPRTVRRVGRACSAEDTTRASTLRHRTERLIKEVGHRPHRQDFHLLVFTHGLSLGGGELYLSELLRHLAPQLPRCTVVSPADGELREVLEEWGIEVVVTGRTISNDAETYEGHIRELSLFILGSEPDVVLLNTLGVWSAGDAAQRIGLPTIWSIHESFELEHWLEAALGHAKWHPYLKDRLLATLAATDRLVFEAEATSELFAPYADAERRVVVRYGVDIDGMARYEWTFDREAARAEYEIRDDAVVLLSVGVIVERKAAACLMEAFIEIADVHPEATLVIIGDYRCAYSEILHGLIDDAGLDDRLRLLPITPDIWQWYALSDVLVSASDIESLPRCMLEAMAFGLPSLSTDVFGVPEVIEDGRNGWLFPARDMVALVAALHRVLSFSPEERKAVGEAARETAERDHRSEGYGEAYRQMIDELARKHGQRLARPD
jgi:glycosyltransferase involved in cell wall biosynthesis